MHAWMNKWTYVHRRTDIWKHYASGTIYSMGGKKPQSKSTQKLRNSKKDGGNSSTCSHHVTLTNVCMQHAKLVNGTTKYNASRIPIFNLLQTKAERSMLLVLYTLLDLNYWDCQHTKLLLALCLLWDQPSVFQGVKHCITTIPAKLNFDWCMVHLWSKYGFKNCENWNSGNIFARDTQCDFVATF